MAELTSRTAIADSAEAAARHWAKNPKEREPECPYAIGTEAAHAWRAMFQRYLVIYSAITSDEEAGA